MNIVTTVFQFEVRYNHILNFSQIARKILSPFVRLTQSIKLENQNTLEERIVLNFENEDYMIIVSWDRIIIKGQGDLGAFTNANSPVETPFFIILEKLKSLEEFGSIQNILFAINYIKKLDISKDNLVEEFTKKTMKNEVSEILDNKTDLVIVLETSESGEEKTVTFGPYFGTEELKKRHLIPVKIENLEDTNFFGLLLEYKHFKLTTDVNFSEFVALTKISNNIIKKVWKIF